MAMKPYFADELVTIYHGDAAEVVAELGAFDLLLTDPPYGLRAARRKSYGGGVVHHRSGFKIGACVPKRDYGDASWDDAPVSFPLLSSCMALTRHQIIFGGNYFPLPPSRCWLIWDKLRGDTEYADAEMAWTNIDSTVRMFRFRWNGFLTDSRSEQDERVHPTQKPLALMSWCLARCPETPRSVLDPFAGSGATAVACELAGIPCTLVEAEERYCEIAAKRLGQRSLLPLMEEEP